MAPLARMLRRLTADDQGVAIVEAAVVTPFVLVLGMGIIEFGWLMSQIDSMQTALRDSVRYATRSSLSIASNGTASLLPATATAADSIMSRAYEKNHITSHNFTLVLTPISNSGALYRGGSNVYRISGSTDFTPASAGLLTLINITLPRISLRYEARHVGG